MSISDLITLTGILITISCTLISIRQAKNAKNYSDALRSAKERISLLGLAERLRAAQDPIGQLPQALPELRGSKPQVLVSKIRVEFDSVLSSLGRVGPNASARNSVELAQLNLDSYEDSINDVLSKKDGAKINVRARRVVRTAVQNAIVEISGAAERLDSK